MCITTAIVSWDAGWTALPWMGVSVRDPQSAFGSTVYAPYQALYSKIDMFYATDADFAANVGGKNAFGPAQSVMNLVEIGFQLWYLYLVALESTLSNVVGLCVSVATWSKTVLYFVMLYFYGLDTMLKGTPWQNFTLFLLPNGVWRAYLCLFWCCAIHGDIFMSSRHPLNIIPSQSP
jgi:hypothetical protein